MSRKAEKAKQFHTAKYQLRNQDPVDKPQLNPENKAFFQRAKQVNMCLETVTNGNVNGIQMWTPLPKMMSDKGCVGVFPENSQYKIIQTTDDLIKLTEVLGQCQEFSVDLEGSMEHTFLGMTALMQFGTWEDDYLLDPFPLYNEIIKYIKPIMEDGKILKVFHGGDNDFLWLQRDFDITVVGAVDVQDVYNSVRVDQQKNKIGLKALIGIEFPTYKIDKSVQLEDWRKRPLTERMVLYARADAHFTLRIWNRLRSQVNGYMNSTEKWQEIFSATKRAMLNVYKLRTYPTALVDLAKQSVKPKKENLELYELLHQYRDYCARHNDECPTSVLTTEQLVQLSDMKPKNIEDLSKYICDTKKKFQMDTFLLTLFKIINIKYTYMTRINNTTCHQCLNKGHAAIMCPYPKDKSIRKEYMNQNPEHKNAEVKRRNANKKKNKALRKLAANTSN